MRACYRLCVRVCKSVCALCVLHVLLNWWPLVACVCVVSNWWPPVCVCNFQLFMCDMCVSVTSCCVRVCGFKLVASCVRV